MSTDAGQGERVDRVAGWLLEHGLHLVAATGGEVESAPGWAVHLRGGTGLQVIGPVGELYDGDLQTDPAWQHAATTQGRCLLLVGCDLGLDQAPANMQEAIARLDVSMIADEDGSRAVRRGTVRPVDVEAAQVGWERGAWRKVLRVEGEGDPSTASRGRLEPLHCSTRPETGESLAEAPAVAPHFDGRRFAERRDGC